MINAKQLNDFCTNYFLGLGYRLKPPIGLLNPAYPDAFNPCAGHAEIKELANSPVLEKAVKWLTTEPVYRHLDSQDDFHLTLFEMLTFVDAREKQDASKEEIINQQLGLYKELGPDLKRLHVTTFAGYRLLGKELPADEESERIWTKMLGKDKVHPLRSTSNIEFWQKEGEQAGPRCEIFYEREDNLIEIGTVVFDNHIYSKGTFRQIPNAIYGGAGGIERLEMIINNYQSIWETSTIRPIIDILRQYSSRAGDLRFLQNELLKTSDNLKSALMLGTEGQEKTNKTRRGQRFTKLMGEIRRGFERLNINDIKGVCSDIGEIIQNLYANRYLFYGKIKSEKLAQYFL